MGLALTYDYVDWMFRGLMIAACDSSGQLVGYFQIQDVSGLEVTMLRTGDRLRMPGWQHFRFQQSHCNTFETSRRRDLLICNSTFAF